jgi:hypothetical protein
MGKFTDLLMAVRTFQAAVRAVQIEVLGHIQKPEIFLLVDITESTVLMTEKTVLFINSPGTGRQDANHNNNK